MAPPPQWLLLAIALACQPGQFVHAKDLSFELPVRPSEIQARTQRRQLGNATNTTTVTMNVTSMLTDLLVCAGSSPAPAQLLLFNGSLDTILAQANGLETAGRYLGLGLGEGISSSLNITSGQEGRSLSQSIARSLGAVNTSANSLAESIGVTLGSSLVQSVMQPSTSLSQYVIAGARGLGAGAATGMQRIMGSVLTTANSSAASSSSSDGFESMASAGGEAFTEAFIRGLMVQGRLNGTNLTTFLASNTSIDLAKVTKGFMVGFLQGVQDGVTSVGGVPSILDGMAFKTNASSLTVSPPVPVTFDDSVGGGAVGFAQGLGEKGFLLGLSLLRSSVSGSPRTPIENLTFISTRSEYSKRRIRGAIRRQEVPPLMTETNLTGPATTTPLNMTPAAINDFLQNTADNLGAIGVGSLAVVLQTMQSKGLLPTSSSETANVTIGAFRSLMGGATNTIRSEGNTFSANAETLTVTVNGRPSGVFVRNLIIHVVFLALAYFIMLPILFSFKSYRHLCVASQKPEKFQKAARAQHIVLYGIFTPLAIVGAAFGFLLPGNAGHFRNQHEILGVVALIFAVPMILFHHKEVAAAETQEIAPQTKPGWPARIGIISKNVVLGLGLATGIGGFADLQAITLGLTQSVGIASAVIIGFALGGVLNIGIGISIADSLVSRTKKEGKEGRGGCFGRCGGKVRRGRERERASGNDGFIE